MPYVALGDRAVEKNAASRICVTVDEESFPSRAEVVGVVFVEIVAGVDIWIEKLVNAVHGLEIGIDHRTVWIQSSSTGAVVEIVGAGKADAILQISQRFVVAELSGDHKAEIRDGHPHLSDVLVAAIIGGVGKDVLYPSREGEFASPVKTKSGRVDACRSDIATQGAGGIAHGHAACRSFVVGL